MYIPPPLLCPSRDPPGLVNARYSSPFAASVSQAYSAAVQTQWQWIKQLCLCVEQHVKENAAYFQVIGRSSPNFPGHHLLRELHTLLFPSREREGGICVGAAFS